MKGPDSNPAGQLDAFEDAIWPDTSDFPHNRRGVTVADVVDPDLRASNDPLIITGFSSLNRLVPLLADYESRRQREPESIQQIRILIGHEPHRSSRRNFGTVSHSFSQEVTDYWLERGISLTLSAEVVAARELLNSGLAQIRTSGSRPVHAKMYVTEHAVTLGSSNYSFPGMFSQLEGNVRFGPGETLRFRESRRLAEALWNQGEDYLDELKELLDSLLRWVTWEEALGRACAELLQGKWAKRYLAANDLGDDDWLWPTQEEGIAQALWVLENVGSVLVADATGSGKTKMGAHLVRAVESLNWRTGRIRKASPVIVCPPAVKRAWRREATRCGQAIDTHSHGILSTRNSRKRESTVEAIRRAQILAVDEAHNFLNRGSVRTRTLYANMADHVLLFTATPINRGPEDLLPLIDLLGGDNFDEGVLDIIEGVWRRKNRTGEGMAAKERMAISGAVQGFTVRRTKRMLNAAIDEAPEMFTNALGVRCRYPVHRPHLYPTGESERDREIAAEIREVAGRLRGVTYFTGTILFPEFLAIQGWTEEKYLKSRLKSSRALAGYAISAALRSSRGALLEHLVGSEAAAKTLSIDNAGKKGQTGDLIGRVGKLAGTIPSNELKIPLPKWLSDAAAHIAACEEEVEVYDKIRKLALELSAARDAEKVALLTDLVKNHRRVIAFDRHPITLAFLREVLRESTDFQIELATGSTKGQKERLEDLFALDSEADGILALCSDALSEGINLQGAPVVVHLDMPTVIRLAEQRIGRVDRMDSMHEAIDVYWPDDTPEFALHADELFLNRHRDVADLLGSNVPLPKGMGNGSQVVSSKVWSETVEKYVAEDVKWDGISDVFHPVRQLVEGDTAVVSPDVYMTVRNSAARVVAAVSVVEAPSEWSFYAIGGNNRAAPRWVYFDRNAETPIVDLHEVVDKMTTRLAEGVQPRHSDAVSAQRIKHDLGRLDKWETLMLPRKKRRALEQMKHVLNRYRGSAERDGNASRAYVAQEILDLLDDETRQKPIDFRALADWWMDLIRPVWHEHLSAKRKRPALLKDIRKKLTTNPLSTQQLLTLKNVDLEIQPIGERVVAAIVALD